LTRPMAATPPNTKQPAQASAQERDEMWEAERAARVAEVGALKNALRRCAQSTRDVLCVLPEAGAIWFECGRVFLRLLRRRGGGGGDSSSSGSVRVVARFGPNARGVAAKRAVCWISSPASLTEPFTKLPQAAVACSEDSLAAEVPAASGAWGDPEATLEWVAFAYPPSAAAIGSLCQAIETRAGYDSAAFAELVKRVEAVLSEQQCSVGAGDTKGRTLLHAACSAGNTQLAGWLVQTKAMPVDALDHDMWTPLHCALAGGHCATALFLLRECNADARLRTANGSTTLHSLMSSPVSSKVQPSEFEAVVEMLVKSGVAVDETRADGTTPLMLACKRGRCPSRVEALLRRGADPNKRDANGDTALHFAILVNGPEIVHLLAIAGADDSLRGSRGLLPIELAEKFRDPHLISAVQSMGARFGEIDMYLLAGLCVFWIPIYVFAPSTLTVG